MSNRATIRGDRSKRYRDIAIFRCSRWPLSTILDFEKLDIVTPGGVKRANMRLLVDFQAFKMVGDFYK